MIEIKKPILPITIVVLGLTAVMVGGRFPYIFFYLVTLLFLIPCIWLRISLAKLTGSVDVSQEYGEVGKTLAVTYKVVNPPNGRFPYLELANIVGSSFSLPAEDKVVTLEEGDSAQYQREVYCARRGKYDLKAFQVKTGDPFGFFKLSRSLTAGKEIKIYPKIKFFSQFILPARQHFGNLAVHDIHLENYSQVSDLRDWRVGDHAKRIHWKQSARQGKLVVKNYDHMGDTTLSVFIDMNRTSYQHDINYILEDLAVEAAASLVYICLKENVPIRVLSDSLPGDSLSGSHLRDYQSIMDRLITLHPDGKKSFASYVNNYTYYLSPKSSIYLFSPYLKTAEALLIMDLMHKGFSPLLFYLTLTEPAAEQSYMLDRLKDAGIKTYTLYPTETVEYAS